MTASELVLKTHYLRNGEKNWMDVVERICNEFEKVDKEIVPYLKRLLLNKIIMFNSPALMNLGYSNMCSACFTLTVQDSLDDIYSKLKLVSKIFKEGGGVGLSLGKLREKGAPISAGGTSSGVISWMEQFNQMVDSVKQGGRRRGAMLVTIPYYHPDIEEFVECKTVEYVKKKYNIEDDKEAERIFRSVRPFSNMNLSISVDGEFFRKVENNEDIDLISPATGKVVKRINARELMKKILKNSIYGEPSFLFMDNAEKDNPMPDEGKIDTSNPCLTIDTKITTNKGELTIKELLELKKQKKLHTIKVLSYNMAEDKVEYKPLIDVFKTRDNAEIIKVVTFYGKEVKCTPDHMFFTDFGDWDPGIEYGYLPADKMLGKTIYVYSSKHNNIEDNGTVIDIIKLAEKEPVYDLIVADNHNFFANGVLVHNCGEVLLPSADVPGACNLLTINLPRIFREKGDYSFKNREFFLYLVTRIADDLVELNNAVTPEITKKNKDRRPLGIGVMDLATIFVRNGARYGDEKSVKITEELFKSLRKGLVKASIQLAKERGKHKGAKPRNFLKGIDDEKIKKDYEKYGSRNCALMAMPPTGATGLLCEVNGTGIEPFFGIFYERFVRGQKFLLENKEFIFSEWYRNYKNKPQLVKDVIDNNFSIQNIDYIPKYMKKIFVTASDLTLQDHLNIIGVIIKYTDQSISKTINLPNDFSTDFDNIYAFVKTAYNMGLKGLTFFHPKSLIGSVFSYQKTTKTEYKRPEIVISKRKKLTWKGKTVYIDVGFDGNNPIEVFIHGGKAGEDFHALCWALGWLISKYIQLGGDLTKMFDKMTGIGGSEVTFGEKKSYLSFVDFIFKEVLSLLEGKVKLTCPNCKKDEYIYVSGCFSCNSCGYSKCG